MEMLSDPRSEMIVSESESPASSKPAVAIETHGCKLNQADSSALAWRFVESGYRLVSTEEPADVYILNSCTVTHVADRKARHALRAARRRNPETTIVATGCYAQRSPEILRQLEEVDLVIGNTDKDDIVRQVSDWRGETPVPCAVGDDPEGTLGLRTMRSRPSVKIQEGCNQVCAYCIVPKVRGRERSIPPEEIIDEINRYGARGFKEVVLTGTQLGSYGFDLPGLSLTRLLARILSETDVPRLRVSSLQPQELDHDLVGLWDDRRLCPHFHLPLQSGSDAVLERMRRRYTSRQYADAVDTLRRALVDVSVTADVVAGFPGETDEEFEETLSLCNAIEFADIHVFPYSVRPGTSAAHYDAQVAQETKARRVQALLELAEVQTARFRERQAGKVRPVLWEQGRRSEGSSLWTGLTDNYIKVSCRSGLDLANRITPARLGKYEEGLVHAEAL